MSFVTTEPAPITTWSQMLTGNTVAFVPIDTFLPIDVSLHLLLSPRAGPPSRKRSFTNITPCEIKQLSPMVTSSQINACDCILLDAPIDTPFCISTNGPMKQSSPILQSYRLQGSTTRTFVPKDTFLILVCVTVGSIVRMLRCKFFR